MTVEEVCREMGLSDGTGRNHHTLPPLGYWRAQHAPCSGALAREQGTANPELGGLAC